MDRGVAWLLTGLCFALLAAVECVVWFAGAGDGRVDAISWLEIGASGVWFGFLAVSRGRVGMPAMVLLAVWGLVPVWDGVSSLSYVYVQTAGLPLYAWLMLLGVPAFAVAAWGQSGAARLVAGAAAVAVLLYALSYAPGYVQVREEGWRNTTRALGGLVSLLQVAWMAATTGGMGVARRSAASAQSL